MRSTWRDGRQQRAFSALSSPAGDGSDGRWVGFQSPGLWEEMPAGVRAGIFRPRDPPFAILEKHQPYYKLHGSIDWRFGASSLLIMGEHKGTQIDRFGDFEGFLLETDKGERKFHSRETEMMALAERAWRERLRLTVCADRDEPYRPISIVVRKPPAPFGP